MTKIWLFRYFFGGGLKQEIIFREKLMMHPHQFQGDPEERAGLMNGLLATMIGP